MWKLVGKLLLLGAARRWAKRPTAAVETAALVLVLNERRLGRGAKREVLLRAAHVIFLPAAVIKAVRLARYLAAGKRRGPGDLDGAALPLPGPATAEAAAVAAAAAAAAGAADDGNAADPLAAAAAEAAAAAAGPVPSFRHQPPPLPPPVPRAEWGLLQIPEVAPEYAAWVRCLRNVLAQQGLRSLPPGVDPDGLETTRYLLYNGLLAAHKPADAARAVAATAARVTGSVNWRASYPFMSPRELQEWDDVTWWAGPDPDGTLWLHVHLARAVVRCNRGEGRQCVQAIISQLDQGTRVLMTQTPTEAAAALAAAAGRGGGGGAAAAARSTASSGTATPAPAPSAPASSAGSAAAGGGGTDSEEYDDEGGAGEGAAAGVAAAAARAGGGASTSGRGAGGGGGWRRSREARAGALGRGAGPGGVAGRLDDRIRVVVVGSGSNVRQALRMLPLFREFARLVQRHYPGRLRAMYLVDLPRGLRMSVGAVLNLLSTETRQKVKVCRIEDLPDCIAGAIAARETVQQRILAEQGLQGLGPAATGGEDGPDGGGGANAVGAAAAGGAGVGGSGAAGRLLAALALAAAAAVSRPLGRRTAAQQLQQLHELRLWLVRVVPALVMAAMACLTYKSLLARP
ncbi:hypothetical protein PLESTB_000426000 [Pleodorina starrii]|uniref:CRAL-TRIO domain-containing protein n=1 Tax=Pleodorina starrii TaxID=330485 RepID=A0A9W6BET4_9CHLO|nr:hypothetical protein PLESTM_001698100 [Pleodorina starrii]GLC50733.1 hypothetical protein PLESTB_000426000 [Pleodorina starrii]GLC74362.1 hypothetical protein PLESTF_001503600 [Pleodorina starrii]